MTTHSDFIDQLYDQHYAIWDNFLVAEQYQALVALSVRLYQTHRFQAAGVGRAHQRQHSQQIRRDNICWIDSHSSEPAAFFFLDALQQLLLQFNQQLFLGLWELESHFACYKRGHFYRRHRDQFQGHGERTISCVFYLNEQWVATDGGALVLYEESSKVLTEILPHGNRLVCFHSSLEHEVLETMRDRMSIAAWMKVRSGLPSIG